MAKLKKIQVTKGLFWVEVPDINLYILCGCPADSVKHLMKMGLIVTTEQNGVKFETGPNAILLSDVLLQNGNFSNLAEFPVLQMLYRQGMILPNHPNNNGEKPLLIGSKEQVSSQMEYIYRGNYGLISQEEMINSNVDDKLAKELMRMKLQFAFGKIRNTKELLDTKFIDDDRVSTIKDGLSVKRLKLNIFEFNYKDEKVVIDLNLPPNYNYKSPYPLGFYNIKREYFGVIHSGSGDGWDINNPCMASILMFQGKVYLIDAGPNILDSLISLGVGIDEIEGIFHTHSHDDHFAGLPTLINSDHKIKYFSTPLVRASVTKKLSALLSIEEEDFEKYFEVHDLELDKWNNIDGLEVKPALSPHPVETSIYIFRSLDKDGYKSYAHLSDIASFEVIQSMVGENGISEEFFQKIKSNYLNRVNLKKLDIGGGLIHGKAENFKKDNSDKIVLAHTSLEITDKQKEVGSGAPFGTVDILMPSFKNYLWKSAYDFLKTYFPTIPNYQIQILLNNRIKLFNPETIMLKEGENNESIYLILTGSVEMISSKYGIKNTLSSGTLVGEISGLLNTEVSETYRTLSFVEALELPANLYLEFVMKNNLYFDIKNLEERIRFLKQTWLFSESLSYIVKNKIAKSMNLHRYKEGHIFENLDSLYIIRSGSLERFIGKDTLEQLDEGDFFGEEMAVFKTPSISRVRAIDDVEIYKISNEVIEDIPAVRLKLFETYEKRKNFILNLELKNRKVFEYSDELSINIHKMDNQHKRIIEGANILFKTLSFKDESLAQQDALNYLINHLTSHFKSESELLRMYNYPNIESIERENNLLLDRVLKIQKDFQESKEIDVNSFTEWLKSSFKEHISLQNREYERFLNEKGIF